MVEESKEHEPPVQNYLDNIISYLKTYPTSDHSILLPGYVNDRLLNLKESKDVIIQTYFTDRKGKKYLEFNKCAAKGLTLIKNHEPQYGESQQEQAVDNEPRSSRLSRVGSAIKNKVGQAASAMGIRIRRTESETKPISSLDTVKSHYEKYYRGKTLFDILKKHASSKDNQGVDINKEIHNMIEQVYESDPIPKINIGGRRKKTHKRNKKNKRKKNARRNKRTKNYTRKKR